MACRHCQKPNTIIGSICDSCGFNQENNRFSWIKVRLDKIQRGANISIEELVHRHASTTQKAPHR